MRFNLYLLYPITHTVLPVDAHVGKALFTDAIVDMLQSHGKTVILVTHALHFLSQCDYIYTVASGRIGEHGTFDDLMARGGEFARLSREFGGEQERKEEEEKEEEAVDGVEEKNKGWVITTTKTDMKSELELKNVVGKGTLEGRLMVKETRSTGAIPWRG